MYHVLNVCFRGTGLYELWKTGRYQSYPAATLVDLVARILALVPPWTRVYRVQRDIPMPLVTRWRKVIIHILTCLPAVGLSMATCGSLPWPE